MKYSNDDIISSIRDVAESLGKPPTMEEWDNRKKYPTAQTIQLRFSTWNNALRKAGVGVNRGGRKRSASISGRHYHTSVKKYLYCSNCGEERSPCLCFHHTDSSEKEFTISQNTRKTAGKLYNEMKKCVVLCANCHRLHHSDEYRLTENDVEKQFIPSPMTVLRHRL